jgi:hypothetical protein
MSREKKVPRSGCHQPDASVVPTPLRLVNVAMACSTLGNFLNAFLLSDCTALGVLMRTKLVNWGKNFPRCEEKEKRSGNEKLRKELKSFTLF